MDRLQLGREKKIQQRNSQVRGNQSGYELHSQTRGVSTSNIKSEPARDKPPMRSSSNVALAMPTPWPDRGERATIPHLDSRDERVGDHRYASRFRKDPPGNSASGGARSWPCEPPRMAKSVSVRYRLRYCLITVISVMASIWTSTASMDSWTVCFRR